MTHADSVLLSPIESFANRVWMAPLTRSRATMPGNVPNDLMETYYEQRASAGLIIAEATPISPTAHGYYATPGIHTDAQQEAWKVVTDRVHAKGGKIFLQLWHVGRVSSSALQPDNQAPVGPTDVISESKTYIDDSMERHPNTKPRALRTEEIPSIVEDFAAATKRAKAAGFDGVEIHGANSYLLDQFTRDGVNTRTDQYGGSLENRLRFPLMVARAVVEAWGDPSGVGYRISPLSEHKDVRDSDPQATFSALAAGLGALNLEYLHAVEPGIAHRWTHASRRSSPQSSKRSRTRAGISTSPMAITPHNKPKTPSIPVGQMPSRLVVPGFPIRTSQHASLWEDHSVSRSPKPSMAEVPRDTPSSKRSNKNKKPPIPEHFDLVPAYTLWTCAS